MAWQARMLRMRGSAGAALQAMDGGWPAMVQERQHGARPPPCGCTAPACQLLHALIMEPRRACMRSVALRSLHACTPGPAAPRMQRAWSILRRHALTPGCQRLAPRSSLGPSSPLARLRVPPPLRPSPYTHRRMWQAACGEGEEDDEGRDLGPDALITMLTPVAQVSCALPVLTLLAAWSTFAALHVGMASPQDRLYCEAVGTRASQSAGSTEPSARLSPHAHDRLRPERPGLLPAGRTLQSGPTSACASGSQPSRRSAPTAASLRTCVLRRSCCSFTRFRAAWCWPATRGTRCVGVRECACPWKCMCYTCVYIWVCVCG